jgi:hypothetical protein
MFNFNKKKDIVLDCYTSSIYAYNFARINHGHHFIPDWWKKEPNEIHLKEQQESMPSIKKCPAIVQYYKNGIILPLWCDLKMFLHPNGTDWNAITSHNEVSFEKHPREQFAGFTKEHGESIKIISPWRFHCREKILFTMSQPIWSNRDFFEHFHLLPGVLDFKTQSVTNLNFFVVRKNEEIEFNINPLTPMVIFHPHTERNIIIKHHFVENAEKLHISMNPFFSMFNLEKFGDATPLQIKKRKQFIEKVDQTNKEIWRF